MERTLAGPDVAKGVPGGRHAAREEGGPLKLALALLHNCYTTCCCHTNPNHHRYGKSRVSVQVPNMTQAQVRSHGVVLMLISISTPQRRRRSTSFLLATRAADGLCLCLESTPVPFPPFASPPGLPPPTAQAEALMGPAILAKASKVGWVCALRSRSSFALSQLDRPMMLILRAYRASSHCKRRTTPSLCTGLQAVGGQGEGRRPL